MPNKPYGVINLLSGGLRFFTSNAAALYVGLRGPASDPASSFNFRLPNALPGSTQALTVDTSGNMSYASLSGSGSVTSFSSGNLSPLFTTSVATATTTPALSFSLSTQAANAVFAGPTSGGSAAPTFRALVYADLSGLVGTTGSTIAAGNDSRLHTQNTDSGTTQTSFQIDSGNTGPRLKNSSGSVRLRNAADSADADLIVANLQVTGTTTTVNSETVTIDDNIIVLNNNVSSGTPTEDGGVQVRRGASTSASVLWDETNDFWKAGLAGSEVAIARCYSTTFTSASLPSNVLTVTHNLGRRVVGYTIADNNFQPLGSDDGVTFVDANSFTVDLTSFATISGTWTIFVWG